MKDLKEKQLLVGEEIFKEVIEKKVKTNITTNNICTDLNLDEEDVTNYFLGLSKTNLPLGIKILDYLEDKEVNLGIYDNTNI